MRLEEILDAFGEEMRETIQSLLNSRDDSEEVENNLLAVIESFQIYDEVELGSKEMERDLKIVCENYDEIVSLANEFIERGVEFASEGLGFLDPVVARSKDEIGKAMRAAMMVLLGILEYDRSRRMIYW